ncbi:Rv0909 family putative TA system antitoxin [Corynebacterium sp. A21]|uniref:Rv0909 family putative TA system antitoxin n=1 Tax=Corynebacterium sp. A21 TaxID=3457318 RepID=UPI003FD56620
MSIFDKAKEALNNEQHSDAALDKAADLAKGKLGEDKADQINQVRDQADDRLGEGNPEQQ